MINAHCFKTTATLLVHRAELGSGGRRMLTAESVWRKFCGYSRGRNFILQGLARPTKFAEHGKWHVNGWQAGNNAMSANLCIKCRPKTCKEMLEQVPGWWKGVSENKVDFLKFVSAERKSCYCSNSCTVAGTTSTFNTFRQAHLAFLFVTTLVWCERSWECRASRILGGRGRFVSPATLHVVCPWWWISKNNCCSTIQNLAQWRTFLGLFVIGWLMVHFC